MLPAIIILSLITAACITVFMFDLVPAALTFIGRIHMGNWEDDVDWYTSVYSVALKWILKTPSVPVSDNTSYTLIDRITGKYKKSSVQSWQEASLLLSVDCNSEYETVQNFICSKIDPETGEWYEPPESIDSAMLAFAIMKSADTQRIYIDPAMEYCYDLINRFVTEDGTVCYSKVVPDVRFVDTVGMICPFLFEYGKRYGRQEAVMLAYRQMGEYLNKGLHPELNIPVHAFNLSKGEPLGIYGWGRGCGWLAVGIMDSILTLDKSDKMYGMLVAAAQTLADAVLEYQQKDGAFCRQLIGEQVVDSSATSMLGWFLYELYNITGEEEYLDAAEKACDALMAMTRRDGKVDLAQGDTKGIGFYSNTFNTLPAAQGFTLRLARNLKKI
ncbi:MAG: glycoside hydrolase family 88 protein [Clostridiales bacterium]|nr:glycoside hydrolase family 88 protein [Clostridiales bacterium]